MENINITQYHWTDALAENLGRDTATQGDRLAVYAGGPDSLTSQALAGETPRITTPVSVGQPDSDGNIPFIVRGFGRIKSVLHWNQTDPLQRLKDALTAALPAAKRGDDNALPISEDEIKELKSVEEVRKLNAVAKGHAMLGSAQAIIDAFSVDIETVPGEFFDGSIDDARRLAYSDVAVTEKTVADTYARYLRLRDAGYDVRRLTAALRETPGRVSHYKRFAEACSSGVRHVIGSGDDEREVVNTVHPTMERVIRVHMAPDFAERPTVGFDSLGGKKYLGYLSKSEGVPSHVQPELVAVAWNRSNPGSKKLSGSDVENMPQPDLIDLARNIDGRELRAAIADWREEERLSRLKAADPEAYEAEIARKDAPDTVTDSAPTIKSVQNLFSAERFGGDKPEVVHPQAEVLLTIGEYVHGHISAETMLDRLTSAKKTKQVYKPGSAMVPTEPGESVDKLTVARVKADKSVQAQKDEAAESSSEPKPRRKATKKATKTA